MSIDAATSDSGQERRLALYRRWQDAQMDLARFSLRRPSALFETVLLLGVQFLFIFPLTAVDAPLWSITDGPFQWSFPFQPSGWTVFLVLCAAMLINASLFQLILSRKGIGEEQLHPGLLALRFLFGGVPILGLYVIPLWQRILVSSPPWVLARPSHPVSLDLMKRSRERKERGWIKRIDIRIFVVVFWIDTVTLLIFHGRWCSTLNPALSGEKQLLAAQSVLFHLVAFAGMTLYLRENAARSGIGPLRSRILLALSILWLLPIPYLSIAGMILVQFVSRESERDGTLTEDALSRQRATGNLPEWRILEENLRRNRNRLPWWQRWRKVLRPTRGTVAAERAGSHLITLCDIRAFSLLLDVALSWLLSVSTRSSPPRALIVQVLLGLVFLGSFFLGAASLVVAAVRFTRRLLGSNAGAGPLSGPSYSRSLAILSISLFVGTIQGQFWTRLRLPQATLPANGLISFCISVYLLTLPGHLLSKAWALKRPLSDHLLRLAFLITLLITMSGVHAAAVVGDPHVVVLFWAVPFLLCSALPGAALLPWLLRPFKARQVLSSGLPVALRTALAFLMITAVSPFGGLSVPAWIWIRQRLWPRYEREWLERLGQRAAAP